MRRQMVGVLLCVGVPVSTVAVADQVPWMDAEAAFNVAILWLFVMAWMFLALEARSQGTDLDPWPCRR